MPQWRNGLRNGLKIRLLYGLWVRVPLEVPILNFKEERGVK